MKEVKHLYDEFFCLRDTCSYKYHAVSKDQMNLNDSNNFLFNKGGQKIDFCGLTRKLIWSGKREIEKTRKLIWSDEREIEKTRAGFHSSEDFEMTKSSGPSS